MGKRDEFAILDHIRSHLPPLKPVEREALERLLVEQGCRDPLVVWQDPEAKERILIDGFNRLDICKRHGLEFKTTLIELPDYAAVLSWMEMNARGRRNHTATAGRYYLGCRYNREKSQHGTNQHTERSGQRVHSSDKTCERIASEEKTSERTVRRAGVFAEQVDHLEEHVGNGIKWLILSEQLGYSEKLYNALTEAESGDAVNAIAAAREAKEGTGKPATVSAVLKQLEPEGDDEGKEDATEMAADHAIQRVCLTITELADQVSLGHLETLVLRLRANVVELEKKLTSRRKSQ